MSKKKQKRLLRTLESFFFLNTHQIPFTKMNGNIEVHIFMNGNKYKFFPTTQRWCKFGENVKEGLDSFKQELNL